MSITAAQVKELRERTGAGMMECKKALVESNGDIEKALEEMRKSGAAKADKKAGRVAAEGVVLVKVSADNKTAAIVEINCETDFVAKDENFKTFADAVVSTALANNIADVDGLLAASAGDASIDEKRRDLISKIGENIQIRRVDIVSSEGSLGAYVHGGRIGVVVNLNADNAVLAKDVAMHIAASNPIVVSRDDVPEDIINKEKEIFSAQAEQSGKPAEIIEKMVTGRINKFLDEVSLLGQPFVKDPNTKVGQLLKSAGAEVNAFTRFVVGEGIEKKEDNFVEEVMAQVRENQ